MDSQHIPVPVKKFRILVYATGDYVCTCSVCGSAFVGDKRAVMCLPCVIKLVEEKFTTTNSAMDAIRKAYIEGYSMGHHHTVEGAYWPEQAADDWFSEQHQ